MAHDVYLSYTVQDKVVADAVCAALEAEKIRCWFSPRDVRPGEKKSEVQKTAIKNCRIMVLIFSANANKSKQILNELIQAANENVLIIPFKIDKILPSGAMEFYLSSTHWLDAMNPPTEYQISKLVKTVDHFLKLEQITSDQGATGSNQAVADAVVQVTAGKSINRRERSAGKMAFTVLSITLLLLVLAYGLMQMLGINFPGPEQELIVYDGTYVIDNETGTIPLASLSIGARVIDPSWEWEFRTASNYSGTGGLSSVIWIVVAHDHYEINEPHVTLLAEELIGLYNYTRRNLISDLGYSYWGSSGEEASVNCDLRSWLNSTDSYNREGFYDAFSESFKEYVLNTTLDNHGWVEGSAYASTDNVFVPSTTELGDMAHENTYMIGRLYPYFAEDGNYKRVGFLNERLTNYWTRSPLSTSNSYLQVVSKDGEFTNSIALSDSGVRPALNLSAEVMVSDLKYLTTEPE